SSPPPEKPEAEAGPPQPTARLASGDSPLLASGFVQGQQYTDRLVKSGGKVGSKALAPFLGELLERIDGLDSIDDAEQALRDVYAGADVPEDLTEAAYALWALATLGGHQAVREDAPEIAA